MKFRASLLFVFIVFFIIYVLSPDGTVWGGYSLQTVPTIGPTATPSATFTATATNSATAVLQATSTQIAVPTNSQATVAITIITPVVNDTASPSLQETATTITATNIPAQVDSSTEEVQPTELVTIVVQNQTDNQNAIPVESQNSNDSEIKNLPPQWFFPLFGTALLVIMFLIIKQIFRKRNHN